MGKLEGVYDAGDFRRLGDVVATVVQAREEEIISACRELMQAAFCDTLGSQVVSLLLVASEPMSLGEIAASCKMGKRSILPAGRIRVILERLEGTGIVVNCGNQARPRYVLDMADRRAQILTRIYGSSHGGMGPT